MISEQEKQAILNGAFGIDRAGRKMKYVGKSASSDYPNFIIVFNEHNEIMCGRWLREGFTESKIATSNFDVVGLWEDKIEPFDLEKALAGRPVMTRDGAKAYIQAIISQPKGLEHYRLIGFGYNGEHKEFLHWDETGKVMADDDSCDDIIGMWKESETESNTVTVTLPRMLKDWTQIW